MSTSAITRSQQRINLDIPKIPPLDSLIDAAVERAPMRNYQIEREKEAQQLVKSARRDWTQYIGAESYYRYGQLGVIGDASQGGSPSTTPIITSSNQSQSWWYVGAYIRIPLFAVVNRAVEIGRLKHTVIQSQYLQEEVADAVKSKVIELYNEVKLNIEILQIKAVLLETDNAQVTEAELNYENRKIDLGRLAQLQEMQAKVATEFATARYAARTSLLKLQELTGIDIIGGYDFKIVK